MNKSASIVPPLTPLGPKPTSAERKADQVSTAAQEIIKTETLVRERKTACLRALRFGKEAGEPPVVKHQRAKTSSQKQR